MVQLSGARALPCASTLKNNSKHDILIDFIHDWSRKVSYGFQVIPTSSKIENMYKQNMKVLNVNSNY